MHLKQFSACVDCLLKRYRDLKSFLIPGERFRVSSEETPFDRFITSATGEGQFLE